jgi:hypothetical protein
VASGEALHGVTDVDIVVVVGPDPTGAARARVRDRCRRATRWLPPLGLLVDDWPLIHDEPGLAQVAARSTLTYGLDHGDAAYSGPGSDVDKIRMLERPGLYGPGRTWRLLAGPDRRPDESADDVATRRSVSWLELQNWWRWAFKACLEPDRPGSAYTCVKLIAEAVRIWLWLTRGEHVADRPTALVRGRAEFPEEAEAFERALRLHGALRHARNAPLADFLPAFVRLSSLIAEGLTRQLGDLGLTEVRLLAADDGRLALPHGGLPRAVATGDETEPRLIPLVDWRALVIPRDPDETFALGAGDPGDPRAVRDAATASRRGRYPTLCTGQLMIRPTPMGGRGRLRAIQCELTDPVSFALARGAGVAEFPIARGLSIEDTARRAVAEHRSWLAFGTVERGGTALGPLITAARAALLWETVVDGRPELPLTVDATLEMLAARAPNAASATAGAREAYHDYAFTRSPAPASVVSGLRSLVLALPAYAGRYAALETS